MPNVKSWLKFANSIIEGEDKQGLCETRLVRIVTSSFTFTMQTYQLGQYGTVTDYTEEREGPGVPPVHFDKWAYIGDTKERVLAVYRDVWDEFYNWEQVECTDKIKELLSSGSPDSKHHQDLEPCEVDTEADTSISSSSYSIMIHDENGAVSCTRVSAETLPLNPSIDPHPRYQMCTPISRSIFWEQDALDEEQSVRFFPYADEDRWNIVEYLDEFESSPLLVWDDMTDPDRERKFLNVVHNIYNSLTIHTYPDDMIHLQAVTILLRGRNPLSLEDIETVKVFPGETLRGTASGVLWSCAQRYFSSACKRCNVRLILRVGTSFYGPVTVFNHSSRCLRFKHPNLRK